MSSQIYSDTSYDLVEATFTCLRALLPYMHYQKTHDNLLMCLDVVLEFVDGDYRSDLNTQKVLDNNFMAMAASILNFNYYNPPTNDFEKTKEDLKSVIKFNFLTLKDDCDDLSLHKNCSFVLRWLDTKYRNEQILESLKFNDYALLPNEPTNIDHERCNFGLSLLKMKALECLLECVNSGEKVMKNTFLKIYTKIDPMIFRKLF